LNPAIKDEAQRVLCYQNDKKYQIIKKSIILSNGELK
jgi:hypothetical protein